MMKTLTRAFLAGALAAGIGTAASAQVRGVTDTEVAIGSNGDLSGPFASFNVQAIKAAQMHFEAVNQAGGVHGRKIRFIVEDHGYQVPKAIQNFNKLINRDRVFAMVLNLGTPMNIAGFKLLEPNRIANVSPLSAARQMVEGDTTYKYAGASNYYDQMRALARYLNANNGRTKFCSMYLPNDFGKEIKLGAEAGAGEVGGEYVTETTHKPDEQDFTGSLSKLKNAGCDAVGLALTVRQVITVVATAKKMGLTDMDFAGSSAAFNTAVARIPGGVTEGFYAAAGWADLVARMDVPEVREWADAFRTKFDEEPGTAAQLGYGAAETLARALEAAGKDLTPESFKAGMESLSFNDPIGDVDIKYGPDDHIGADAIVISQIREGVWREIGRE